MNDEHARFIRDQAIRYFRERRFHPFKSKAWLDCVKGARFFIQAYRETTGRRPRNA